MRSCRRSWASTRSQSRPFWNVPACSKNRTGSRAFWWWDPADKGHGFLSPTRTEGRAAISGAGGADSTPPPLSQSPGSRYGRGSPTPPARAAFDSRYNVRPRETGFAGLAQGFEGGQRQERGGRLRQQYPGQQPQQPLMWQRRLTEPHVDELDPLSAFAIEQNRRSASHSRTASRELVVVSSSASTGIVAHSLQSGHEQQALARSAQTPTSTRTTVIYDAALTHGKGEQLMVWRGDPDDEDGPVGYWHHRIDCGDGSVIHYTGIDGVKSMNLGTIDRTSMQEFQHLSQKVHVVKYSGTQRRKLKSPDEVVARAESKIGHSQYNLLTDNCETFARWCKTGDHVSHQVFEIGFAFLAGSYVFFTGSSAITAIVCLFSAFKLWDRAHNRASGRRGGQHIGEHSVQKSP